MLSLLALKVPKESKLPSEKDLSQEEVDEKAAELFSSDIINGLSDSVWKNRLAAVEDFENVSLLVLISLSSLSSWLEYCSFTLSQKLSNKFSWCVLFLSMKCKAAFLIS